MQSEGDDGDRTDGGSPPGLFHAPRPADRSAPSSTSGFGIGVIGVSARLGLALELVAQWIRQNYRGEIEAGNTFVWTVVSLCGGAAVYFALPHEPSFPALSFVAGFAVLSMAMARLRGGLALPVAMAATAVIGLWTIALEAKLVAAPRLDRERTATVTGWVVDAETVLNGATRMTINVTGMTGYRLPQDVVPKRITVTFRKGMPAFAIGDGIRFLGRLRPLPGPVMPSGYDFARRAYFEGRGGTGYALGRVEHVNPGERPWSVAVAAAISGLRYDMAERIRAALPGAEGAIAAAIIVGETRAIPDAENDALRMSGLPHMITIAGLHMSIVASSVFFGVRFLLSLFPRLALRLSIKKIAATAALLAITFYVLMAGPHISAERAYVMAAIMLVSVIVGRPALTMRNLALSAIVLVAANPAQVIEPGFLMSFLAVMALIAAYQSLARLRQTSGKAYDRHRDHGVAVHIVNSGFRHMRAAAWSSLIATLATASVTADQFYHVPSYGPITNFIVLPAIDMVAMPCAVLTCLLMPFGLEALPLYLMGKAIDFMLAVGAYASALPGGEGLIGRIHPLSDLLAITGLLWLCLWQQTWRLLGVLPVLIAIGLAPLAEKPDILIGEDAKPIAIRDTAGRLRILATKQDRFTVANWLMADADPDTPRNVRAPLDARLNDGWRCDTVGCVFARGPTRDGPALTVAVVIDPRAFEEDCERADIVITRLTAPDHCRETADVVDRTTLKRTGALTLRLNPRLRTAAAVTQDKITDAGTMSPSVKSRLWRITQTSALADPSRPWRQAFDEPRRNQSATQASARLAEKTDGRPRDNQIARPARPRPSSVPPRTLEPDPSPPERETGTADTAVDLVEPLAPDAFIRDMMVADPTDLRPSASPKPRSPLRPDPVDTSDPPDIP